MEVRSLLGFKSKTSQCHCQLLVCTMAEQISSDVLLRFHVWPLLTSGNAKRFQWTPLSCWPNCSEIYFPSGCLETWGLCAGAPALQVLLSLMKGAEVTSVTRGDHRWLLSFLITCEEEIFIKVEHRGRIFLWQLLLSRKSLRSSSSCYWRTCSLNVDIFMCGEVLQM